MINSGPAQAEGVGPPDEAVNEIVRSGALGAITLAGVATVIVIALWFAFYLLVFVPRAIAP